MKKATLILGICFLVAAVLTPLTTTVVTFLLPETFASSAKLLYATNRPARFETAVGKIISRSSLNQVVANLNLTAEWGRKYKQPGQLSPAQCYGMLNKMIQISMPRNSSVIEIKVFSDNRDEAAAIANEVAKVYRRATSGGALIGRAELGLRPVRPNKRLNITVGFWVGATLLIVGIGLLVASRIALNQE